MGVLAKTTAQSLTQRWHISIEKANNWKGKT